MVASPSFANGVGRWTPSSFTLPGAIRHGHYRSQWRPSSDLRRGRLMAGPFSSRPGRLRRAVACSWSISTEWSPVSEVVGVTSYSLDYGTATLALIDIETRVVEPLDGGPGYNNAMKWSPDGALIAYQCTEVGAHDPTFYERMELCVIRPDGTGRRRLTQNEYFDAHPSW